MDHYTGSGTVGARPPVLTRITGALVPFCFVLASIAGIAAFLGGQHNVLMTGSAVCSAGSCSPSHGGSGSSGSGSGSGLGSSSSGTGIGRNGSGGVSGDGADGASGVTLQHTAGGSLVMTGTQVILLIAVALALLAGGAYLYWFSRRRTAERSSR